MVTSTDDLHARDNSSLEITKVKKEVVSGEELKLKIVPVYVDENNKVHQQGTTAYTTNTRDNMNLLIATKKVHQQGTTAYTYTKGDKICSQSIK